MYNLEDLKYAGVRTMRPLTGKNINKRQTISLEASSKR